MARPDDEGRTPARLEPHSLARGLGRVALAVTLATCAGPSVHAAPAKAAPVAPEPGPACAEPTLDDARLMTGRDLSIRAQQSYDARDYVAAIRAWEQALLLMPDQEPELRVLRAHAYLGAYRSDKDERHLHAARKLFEDQADSLKAGSQARAELATEVAGIDAELAELAAARKQAEEQREAQIRREAQAELELRRQGELRKQRAVIRKIYLGVGGSLMSFGVGSLAGMTAFLVNGARLDREGRELAATANVMDGEYQTLLVRGQSQNRAAIATGVIGGVLTAVGISLLIVGAVRYKPLKNPRVAVTPAPGGVQVRF